MPVSVCAVKSTVAIYCSRYVLRITCLRVSKLRDKGLALAATVTGNF